MKSGDMMARIDISVGIVTYNNEDVIATVLKSILQYTKLRTFEIYVFDNNSHDNTLDIISKNYPSVNIIKNAVNEGFGYGHNRIIDRIDSKYYLVVNPDIEIQSDVLSNIADFMDKNDDIGLVSPKVLFNNGKLQVLAKKNPKFKYLIARRVNLKIFNKIRREFEMVDNDLNSVADIEFATGCFMFLRTEVLKLVGGFDQRYFLYFEDADLTRMINLHKRAVYNPDFVVLHEWQRATAKSFKYFMIQVVSMFKYFLKWRKYK